MTSSLAVLIGKKTFMNIEIKLIIIVEMTRNHIKLMYDAQFTI